MTVGIAAAGAAVLNVVEQAGETLPAEVRWLLVGADLLMLAPAFFGFKVWLQQLDAEGLAPA